MVLCSVITGSHYFAAERVARQRLSSRVKDLTKVVKCLIYGPFQREVRFR